MPLNLSTFWRNIVQGVTFSFIHFGVKLKILLIVVLVAFGPKRNQSGKERGFLNWFSNNTVAWFSITYGSGIRALVYATLVGCMLVRLFIVSLCTVSVESVQTEVNITEKL